jgi:hypothetical protein
MNYPSGPPSPPSGPYGSGATGVGPTPPGPPTGPFAAPGPPGLSLAIEVTTPPIGWLVAAIVAGLVALAVVLGFGGAVEWAVVAWVIAGPVAIGLLAGFTIHDNRRQTSPLYDNRRPLVPSLYWPAVAVAGAGIAISAWYIADWVGRL